MILDLNFDNLKASDEGLCNYYWPISMRETDRLSHIVNNSMMDLLIELKALHHESYELIQVLSVFFMSEIMQMVNVALLYERCKKDNYKIVVESRYRLLSILMGESQSNSSPFLQQLRDGPPKNSILRFPLRFANDIVQTFMTGVSRFGSLSRGDNSRVATLSFYKVMSEWGKETKQKLRYTRYNYWFGSVATKKRSLTEEDSLIIDKIMLMVVAIFSQFNIDFPLCFKKNFSHVVKCSFGYVRCHLKQLGRHTKLPKKIFLHTGGSMWNRMLAVAVRGNGGFVTGFDHAAGNAYMQDSSDYFIRENFLVDDFVMYSKAQKQCLIDDINKSASHLISYCNVHATSKFSVCHKSYIKRLSKSTGFPKKKITIMCVFYPYIHERVDLGYQFMSDIMLIDWQIRILKKLKRLGYNVILKSHSDSIRPPKFFENIFGTVVDHEPFENSDHNDVDVFLFSALASTLISVVLLSGKPMVYVDFGINQMKDEALALFEQRCSIVPGYFDDQNKACVDLSDLQVGIKSSFEKKNINFSMEYFNAKYDNHGKLL